MDGAGNPPGGGESWPGRPGKSPDWKPGEDTYTEELAREICDVVAVQPRSLVWLCMANPHWPGHTTIWNWRDKRPDFRAAFDEGRRRLADELAFQSIEIADNSSGDVKLIPRRDGSTYPMQDQEFAKRSDLRVKARQWLASKLAPEVYGDRVDVNARHVILTQEQALDQLR